MRYGILALLLLGGCATKTSGAADGGAPADLADGVAADLSDAVTADLAGSAAPKWVRESGDGIFFDVWGASATDVYAVGTGGNVSGYIYHSPGAAVWTQIKGTGPLYAVWGSGADDVYVAGLDMILHSTDRGATWKSETLPAVSGSWLFDALWGSGAGDVYVAGFSTDSSGTKTGSSILHSSGSGTWTVQYGSSSNGSSFSLWGADAAHVFAVDRSSGAVVRSSGNGAWTANGALGPARRIWGLAATQLYVTAANGIAFGSSDGVTWTPSTVTGAGSEFLEDICGSASDDLFIVGNQGSIFHRSASGWSKEGAAGARLNALWRSGADLFAAGADGVYHRR